MQRLYRFNMQHVPEEDHRGPAMNTGKPVNSLNSIQAPGIRVNGIYLNAVRWNRFCGRFPESTKTTSKRLVSKVLDQNAEIQRPPGDRWCRFVTLTRPNYSAASSSESNYALKKVFTICKTVGKPFEESKRRDWRNKTEETGRG